jgi:hypothetical protein
MADFQYQNTEIKVTGKKKTIRRIKIRGNSGRKSVSVYSRKTHMGTANRQLTESEIQKIRKRHFIQGLFLDCKVNKKSCRRKRLAGKTIKRQ